MSLEKTINADYIQAMKAKDKVKSSTLNFLRAQLKNLLIEQRAEELKDPDVIGVIKKQVKQRKDSIEQYRQGNRDDLVSQEEAELKILQTYLPEELPEEQIVKIVEEVIGEIEASSMKDMGRVMKAVSQKIAGRADNKMVSEIVKAKLQGA